MERLWLSASVLESVLNKSDASSYSEETSSREASSPGKAASQGDTVYFYEAASYGE